MKPGFRKRHKREGTPRINTMKKGIYILPSFLTSLSLLCGFYSIVVTFNGEYVKAAWAILVAGIFDGIDGRVARITNATTRFGVEYDSLSDLVAFGVAPAVLVYGWALQPFGRWGWLAAFLYVACGAIRLARFNIQISTAESKFFLGLPIPLAAGLVVTSVIFFSHFAIGQDTGKIPVLLTIYCLAFLMVSTVRYYSFKELHIGRRKPFNTLIILILLIFIFGSEPQIMLFASCLAYVLSGPTSFLFVLMKRRKLRQLKKVERKSQKIENNNGWQ
jgi:CDP-diacylglycerol--serine O-phosphatidyltransferase